MMPAGWGNPDPPGHPPEHQEQIGMAIANIDVGAQVSDRDGWPLGRVTRFVVDPATRRLDALVVGDGPFSIDEWVADIALVEREADGAISLSVDREEAGRLPHFAEREVAPVREPDPAPVQSHTFDPVFGFPGGPDEGDEYPATHSESPVPETDIVLGRGTAVVTADGFTAGHLHSLSLDDQHRLDGIAMSSGHLFKHHVRLPLSSVAELTANRILLTEGLDAVTDAVNEADIQPA
jgi:hypothetical protein